MPQAPTGASRRAAAGAAGLRRRAGGRGRRRAPRGGSAAPEPRLRPEAVRQGPPRQRLTLESPLHRAIGAGAAAARVRDGAGEHRQGRRHGPRRRKRPGGGAGGRGETLAACEAPKPAAAAQRGPRRRGRADQRRTRCPRLPLPPSRPLGGARARWARRQSRGQPPPPPRPSRPLPEAGSPRWAPPPGPPCELRGEEARPGPGAPAHGRRGLRRPARPRPPSPAPQRRHSLRPSGPAPGRRGPRRPEGSAPPSL